jgi:hypothetical protein
MRDLGFDIANALEWFANETQTPYIFERVTDESAEAIAERITEAVRRCYISDASINARATALGVARQEVLGSKLPDPGATMAGDFGEILIYFYHAARLHPSVAFGPKKWRLKQDRTKPTPHSDVIQFILPSWPTPTDSDVVVCSEVKVKATESRTWRPIPAAIEGCEKDRTSRLARTLVWLRERLLTEDIGSVRLEHLNRFIEAIDHPPAIRRFCAVAVICSSLVEEELETIPDDAPQAYSLVIVSVPSLKELYGGIYDAVRNSVNGAE